MTTNAPAVWITVAAEERSTGDSKEQGGDGIEDGVLRKTDEPVERRRSAPVRPIAHPTRPQSHLHIHRRQKLQLHLFNVDEQQICGMTHIFHPRVECQAKSGCRHLSGRQMHPSLVVQQQRDFFGRPTLARHLLGKRFHIPQHRLVEFLNVNVERERNGI